MMNYYRNFLILKTVLKNHYKIAWRNLVGDKGYTLANLIGLSVGMAAAMLIFLWANGEMEYDRFYKKTNRLYQVYHSDIINGEPAEWYGIFNSSERLPYKWDSFFY